MAQGQHPCPQDHMNLRIPHSGSNLRPLGIPETLFLDPIRTVPRMKSMRQYAEKAEAEGVEKQDHRLLAKRTDELLRVMLCCKTPPTARPNFKDENIPTSNAFQNTIPVHGIFICRLSRQVIHTRAPPGVIGSLENRTEDALTRSPPSASHGCLQPERPDCRTGGLALRWESTEPCR